MNKKQQGFLWTGIVFLILVGLRFNWALATIWAIIFAVIGGVIYIFKDKKPKNEQKQ